MGKIVAYSVLEEDELTGGIVFAKSIAAARRQGASQFHDGEWDGLLVRRAQWADQYGDTASIPLDAYLSQGWWAECSFCSKRIDYDEVCEPVGSWQQAFCDRRCEAAAVIERATRKAAESLAIERLISALKSRIPTALASDESNTFHRHAYVERSDHGWLAKQCAVCFDFPGRKHGWATIRYDEAGAEPVITIPSGDLAAWDAWRDAGYPAAPEPR